MRNGGCKCELQAFSWLADDVVRYISTHHGVSEAARHAGVSSLGLIIFFVLISPPDDSMLPLALSLALLSPAVAAVESQRPRSVITRGDGFVRASVNAISGLPSLRRRQFEAPVANHRLGTQYCIDVSIGTPAQTLTLILDTGSPDLWVNPTCATANIPEECKKYPQFDYKKSKTLNATGFADVLSYGKGNVSIEYIRDTVAIGSKLRRPFCLPRSLTLVFRSRPDHPTDPRRRLPVA